MRNDDIRIVNIIGKCYGWDKAPAISDQYDSWGITQLLLRRPVDLVIDMNVYNDMRWGAEELKENDKVKVICAREDISYIGLENYPLDKVVKFFGVDYFSNTVDYAIALAIYRKYDEINLHGVSMITNTEYAYQKPGVDFWCGMAIGKGIKLRSYGKQTSIMKTHNGLLYGYDTKQTIRKD